MDSTFSLQLTASELAFVIALIIPESTVGGTLTGDQEIAQIQKEREMRKSMREKGFVGTPLEVDNQITLDRTVAAMVNVLSFPESAVVVTSRHERAPDPETWRLCATRGLIVDQHEEPVKNHILTACHTRNIGVERLIGFLDLKEQPAAHAESFHVPAEDMAQLPYIIAGNGREDGATFLLDKGVPEQAASRLAAALDNPVQQSLIQAVIWIDGEPQEVGHLTLLEEVYGLWMILPTEEDDTILEIATCTAKEASERIRALAYQVLPPELA